MHKKKKPNVFITKTTKICDQIPTKLSEIISFESGEGFKLTWRPTREWWVGFFVLWHTNLRRLFNAKAILLQGK